MAKTDGTKIMPTTPGWNARLPGPIAEVMSQKVEIMSSWISPRKDAWAVESSSHKMSLHQAIRDTELIGDDFAKSHGEFISERKSDDEGDTHYVQNCDGYALISNELKVVPADINGEPLVPQRPPYGIHRYR